MVSLNCDVHLAEQKLVDLTVVLVDLKRHIISSCKLYLFGCLDYHGYIYTIVNTWRSVCLGIRGSFLINPTRVRCSAQLSYYRYFVYAGHAQKLNLSFV